jgi:hypothetical protein
MFRVEFTFQGQPAVAAYDGKDEWQSNFPTGKKDPELLSSDDKKDFEESADMDGPLVDYQS